MLSFILGGARSGKSELGELQAAKLEQDLREVASIRPNAEHVRPQVTYVATGTVTDGEMAVRIDQHRRRRPERWKTLEVKGLDEMVGAVFQSDGVILLDSLGTWLAGFEKFEVDFSDLGRALRLRRGHAVVISEEVGLGVHPSYQSGRAFRDCLGDLNRYVAGLADQVWFVVAGIPVLIGGLQKN